MAVAKEGIFGSNAAMFKGRGRVQGERPPIITDKQRRKTNANFIKVYVQKAIFSH